MLDMATHTHTPMGEDEGEEDETIGTPTHRRPRSPHSFALSDIALGSPFSDVYHVYRSGEWERVPQSLLVRGDVIALTEREAAPTKCARMSTTAPFVADETKVLLAGMTPHDAKTREERSEQYHSEPPPETRPSAASEPPACQTLHDDGATATLAEGEDAPPSPFAPLKHRSQSNSSPSLAGRHSSSGDTQEGTQMQETRDDAMLGLSLPPPPMTPSHSSSNLEQKRNARVPLGDRAHSSDRYLTRGRHSPTRLHQASRAAEKVSTVKVNAVLGVCGNLACYMLLDTPALDAVREYVFTQPPGGADSPIGMHELATTSASHPQSGPPLAVKHFSLLQRTNQTWMWRLFVAVFLCGILRITVLTAQWRRVLDDDELDNAYTWTNSNAWSLYVVAQPAAVLLCFIFFNETLIYTVAEMIGTAQVMAFLVNKEANVDQATDKYRAFTHQWSSGWGWSARLKGLTLDASYDGTDREAPVLPPGSLACLLQVLQVRLGIAGFAAPHSQAGSGHLHTAIDMGLASEVGIRDSDDRVVREQLLQELVFGRSFGVIERLGACTMFCVVDDEIICEPASIVEEVGIVSVKEGRNHHQPATSATSPQSDSAAAAAAAPSAPEIKSSMTSGTELKTFALDVFGSFESTRQAANSKHIHLAYFPKFEDPQWHKYLSSLKPVGLACMATYFSFHGNQQALDGLAAAASPFSATSRHPGHRSAPIWRKVEDDEHEEERGQGGIGGEKAFRRATHRLVEHVSGTDSKDSERHLMGLADAIGFSFDHDFTARFRGKTHFHIVSPKLHNSLLHEDAHAQSQENVRRRGVLNPHLVCAVVENRESRVLQMMTRGEVGMVVDRCNDYWDGQSISPLSQDLRRAILDLHQQWNLEDLDVVAFSYTPVPVSSEVWINDMSPSSNTNPNTPPSTSSSLSLSPPGAQNPDSSAPSGASRATKSSLFFHADSEHLATAHTFPATPYVRLDLGDSSKALATRARGGSMGNRSGRERSRSGSSSGGIGVAGSGSGGGGAGAVADPSDHSVAGLVEDQIFLGMVASRILLKPRVQRDIDDIMGSGVRFVFFSPRNMRRSKNLAEKLGLETDWNCAISLRELSESGMPDPHRMKSSYADWDVNARLPHGISAIREHLDEIDNVPLLVSLFTDATPSTIHDMFSIFHENHGAVLCIGSAHRASNFPLFQGANFSIAVDFSHGPPSPLTAGVGGEGDEVMGPGFSALDLQVNNLLNALPCGIRVPEPAESKPRINSSILTFLARLVLEGRRVLWNTYKALSYHTAVVYTLASTVALSAAVPIPEPASFDPIHVLWVLFLTTTFIGLPMLYCYPHAGTARHMPWKDEEGEGLVGRHAPFILGRTLPTAVLCVLLSNWAFGEYIIYYRADAVEDCAHDVSLRWAGVLWCPEIHSAVSDAQFHSARQCGNAVMLFVMVASVALQSASYIDRAAPLRAETLFRNPQVGVGMAFVVLLQALYSGLKIYSHSEARSLAWMSWPLVLVSLLWPVVSVALGEQIKVRDSKLHNRFMTLLRFDFETKLGMYSPK